MGRPPAMTKIGEARIHKVRGRGGNTKFRALKLDAGNFSWGTEVCTRKVRVLDVMYNSTNNELVRTKTLVKGAIVMIDAHAFKAYTTKTAAASLLQSCSRNGRREETRWST